MILGALPSLMGIPVAVLCIVGFALCVFAIFYIINQMKP